MLWKPKNLFLAQILAHILLALLLREGGINISAVKWRIHKKVGWVGCNNSILDVQEEGQAKYEPLIVAFVSYSGHEWEIGVIILAIIWLFWLKLIRVVLHKAPFFIMMSNSFNYYFKSKNKTNHSLSVFFPKHMAQ